MAPVPFVTRHRSAPAPPPPATARKSGKASAPVTINGQQVPTLAPGIVSGASLSAAGVRVYDPGFAHTLACTSAITSIDGARGILQHRGIRIEELAEKADFLQVAYLLTYGRLPDRGEDKAFRGKVLSRQYAQVPREVKAVVEAVGGEGGHPMTVLVAALASMGAEEEEGVGEYKEEGERDRALWRAVGVMPALAAGVLRKCAGDTPAFLPVPACGRDRETYAGRFLELAGIAQGKGEAARRGVFERALERLLVLHADHEQNCSTSAVRHVSSSGASVWTALSAGSGALSGKLHGGATEAVVEMLERVGEVGRVEGFLQGVRERREKLMGFGHRVYKSYDPRARVIRGMAREVMGEGEGGGLFEVARVLEEKGLGEGFLRERGLFPNCDFYSGIVYGRMGVKKEGFTVLFAMGRVAGWMAHWREFLGDEDRRIARPRQRYVGKGVQGMAKL